MPPIVTETKTGDSALVVGGPTFATIALALLCAVVGGRARAGEPAKAAAQEVAKGLDMVRLVDVDDRYVYYDSPDPTTFSQVKLMRVPKAGGRPESAPVPPHALSICYTNCRFLIACDDRDSLVDAALGTSCDIDMVDDATGLAGPIVRKRPHPSNLVVVARGLAWVEADPQPEKELPQRIAVVGSDLYGRNVRELWKGWDSRLVGLTNNGSELFLFLTAPTHLTPPKKKNGAWRYVRPGKVSSVWSIPQPVGEPRQVWKIEDLLVAATFDGDDLYACTGHGLYKIAARGNGAAARVGANCVPPLLIWKGWRFQAEDKFEAQPLLFARIDSREEMKELFHATFGMGIVTDDQAIYACVVSADPGHCDLTRIDAAALEARAKPATK